MKLLIVIDMQNDFIDGSLGTKEAVAIVPNVAKKIEMARSVGETVVFTRDTHQSNYLKTQEGKNLQVYFDEEMNASGDTITFTYDFGDDWTFPIRLEEIIDNKVYEEASPLVLDGEGLGIIEDVGGVGAMSDCVKAFEKKSGDDYESYSEWLGIKDLDITYFNKNAVNKSLKKEIKAIDKAYKTME